MDRRTALATLGAAGLVTAAGCVQGTSESGDGDGPSETVAGHYETGHALFHEGLRATERGDHETARQNHADAAEAFFRAFQPASGTHRLYALEAMERCQLLARAAARRADGAADTADSLSTRAEAFRLLEPPQFRG